MIPIRRIKKIYSLFRSRASGGAVGWKPFSEQGGGRAVDGDQRTPTPWGEGSCWKRSASFVRQSLEAGSERLAHVVVVVAYDPAQDRIEIFAGQQLGGEP